METAKLERFRRRLLRMQARLASAVNDIEEALLEDVVTPGDVSTIPTHLADMDEEGVEEEIALAENEEGILEAVIAALDRIDKGQFGRCTNCGREISEERLEAIPYTPYCIDCAQARERSAAT